LVYRQILSKTLAAKGEDACPLKPTHIIAKQFYSVFYTFPCLLYGTQDVGGGD